MSIKTAENKLLKLVKDLERRTGKDLGAGTLTARSASKRTGHAFQARSYTIRENGNQTGGYGRIRESSFPGG